MNAALTKRSSRVREPLRFIFSFFVAASDTTSIQAFLCGALFPLIKVGQASCFRFTAVASYGRQTTLLLSQKGIRPNWNPSKMSLADFQE
jgi:hypothetical protein